MTVPWIIAIGASGPQGLDDIKALLAALPAAFPAVALVVLHRPWTPPSHLKDVLARVLPHPVRIADDGEHLVRGAIYIGEPAQHLTLVASVFGNLIDDPNRQYGGRTVDLLLMSVAKQTGGRMIGVILSGNLDDGSRGLAAIHHAGGVTMVLTPTSGQTGMPENAIAWDGPIDFIGAPAAIASEIMQVIGLTDVRPDALTKLPAPNLT